MTLRKLEMYYRDAGFILLLESRDRASGFMLLLESGDQTAGFILLLESGDRTAGFITQRSSKWKRVETGIILHHSRLITM